MSSNQTEIKNTTHFIEVKIPMKGRLASPQKRISFSDQKTPVIFNKFLVNSYTTSSDFVSYQEPFLEYIKCVDQLYFVPFKDSKCKDVYFVE